MKIKVFLFFMALSLSVSASTPFCQGFSDGYKSVAGDFALAPICPIPPIGGNDYMSGYTEGVLAASL